MNTIPQKDSQGSPQLDERLWQEWVAKGRESSKTSSAKRLRIIQGVLLVGIAAAAFQYFLK